MKSKLLFVLLLSLLLTATAAAQKAPESKSFVPKPAATPKPSGPAYDLATEATFKGVVEEVKEVPNSCMGETGLHVMLKTSNGTVEIQVAPVEFLKMMEVAISQGDKLEIVGSKVIKDGSPLILARSINRDNNEMIVRDNKGAPVWTWMKKG
jgi:hypothetical protein